VFSLIELLFCNRSMRFSDAFKRKGALYFLFTLFQLVVATLFALLVLIIKSEFSNSYKDACIENGGLYNVQEKICEFH